MSHFPICKMEIIIVTLSQVFVENKIAGAYKVDCLTLSAYTIQAVCDVSQQHGMANCYFGEFS